MGQRPRRKRAAVSRVPAPRAQRPDERWSMDFVRETLADGRPFRVWALVDDATREAPLVLVDRSLPAARVVEALDTLLLVRGRRGAIVCDNGPEIREPGARPVGKCARNPARFHPAGAPRGELLHRELQREVAGRVPEHPSLRLARGGPARHRSLAGGVQHRAAAPGFGPAPPGRVRGPLHPRGGCLLTHRPPMLTGGKSGETSTSPTDVAERPCDDACQGGAATRGPATVQSIPQTFRQTDSNGHSSLRYSVTDPSPLLSRSWLKAYRPNLPSPIHGYFEGVVRSSPYPAVHGP